MTTTNGARPSAAPLADEAGGELFPPYPRLSITTTVECEGFTLTVQFNDTPIAAALEALKRRGCRPAGAAGQQEPAPQAAPPAAERRPLDTVPHAYAEQPTCPHHHEPKKQGRYGPYCPRKGLTPETSNDKGYCIG